MREKSRKQGHLGYGGSSVPESWPFTHFLLGQESYMAALGQQAMYRT